ncbi:hypothetical protein TTHERM_00925460 (macronuclear) [Tetrahymena thermophila SB210]|uniref:Uncharacterized protein n=1 Tax=Tetrahymena thermophila (strain SB210) TaxID=312017 RepID=Q22E12_TETTS|nr:hypothetical protein TTHERM_00925460 [Tetrahymena thermophila SB210]EAR83500.1 hypothetical protein TTHERM_00925460 [Tetrahymena thermophila SB210]|eukprot:XP_001031163.1 hypothetical protein TTHERM_00925460 [Tetrahymena thermophila SB210]
MKYEQSTQEITRELKNIPFVPKSFTNPQILQTTSPIYAFQSISRYSKGHKQLKLNMKSNMKIEKTNLKAQVLDSQEQKKQNIRIPVDVQDKSEQRNKEIISKFSPIYYLKEVCLISLLIYL